MPLHSVRHSSRLLRRITTSTIGFGLVAIAACGGGGGDSITNPGGPPAVASIAVSPTAPSVVVGQTTTLAATTKDASGNVLTGQAVTWSSAAASVATVDANGTVKGVALGTAIITAASGSASATVTVTVTPVPVASISVTPAAPSVVAGQTTALTATTKDASGNVLSGQTVTWSSSATSVATVDANGIVTGVSPGTATITAASGTASTTATVTVTAIPVASVTVAPATITLTYFDTTTVSATPKDASGTVLTGRQITWSSSDTTIAKVSASGLVSAVGVGKATISATSEGQVGRATITVTEAPVAQIVPNPTTMSIKVGATQTFTVTLLDSSGNKLFGRLISIVPTGTSANVVQTGQQYTVTGASAGTTTLTISSEPASAATVTVTVTP